MLQSSELGSRNKPGAGNWEFGGRDGRTEVCLKHKSPSMDSIEKNERNRKF